MNASEHELLELYSDPTANDGDGDRVTVTLTGVSEILRRHQRRIAEKTGARRALGIIASDLVRLSDHFTRDLSRQGDASRSCDQAPRGDELRGINVQSNARSNESEGVP